MPSLTQILAAHRHVLVLDAASMDVQVGLLGQGRASHWHCQQAEAGTAAFGGVEVVLRAGGLDLAHIDAFIFCEGPGSMLGIRTVAMALRTWEVLRERPLFAYHSLALAARFAWQQAPRELAVIADARRENWHVQRITSDGVLAPLQRMAAVELAAGELLTPRHFRSWSPVPLMVRECSYDLATLCPAIADATLFRAEATPDAFQHEMPEYKKWSAEVHSSAKATK